MSGLHIRINMQTGAKEAKINDPTETDDNDEETGHKINLKDIQIIDSPKDRQKPEFLPTDATLDPQSVSNLPDPSTEYSLFLNAVSSLSSTKEETLLNALVNLEFLSHDREYGVQLISLSLDIFLKLLETHSSSRIRQACARCLGSSLLNNPEAQALTSPTLIPTLLTILEKEFSAEVQGSLIFALNAAIAREVDVSEFLRVNGGEVLRRLVEEGDKDVKGKCAVFVEDKVLRYRGVEGVDGELEKWCQLFQESLFSTESSENNSDDDEDDENDDLTMQKVLSCLIAIKKEARDICKTEPQFLVWLADHITYPDENMDEETKMLIKDARHVFGNPKGGRRTSWEEEPKRERDEL